jgi:hypothetical protein
MVEFVPATFQPPRSFTTEQFLFEPLGLEHNEADHAAWSSSIDHIRSTPGFGQRSWPREMTLDENRHDLERHAADFAAREGFTYTVRDPNDGETVGCLYIYPADASARSASVRSWVRADRAELDKPLRTAVRDWLDRDWPFATVDYPG